MLVAIGFGTAVVMYGEQLMAAAAPESPPAPDPDGWPIEAPPPSATAAIVATAAPDAVHEPSEPPPPVEETPSTPLVVEQAEGITRSVHQFGKARGFRDGLRKAGASPDEADALITALDKLVDPRRCRPEHKVVWERTEDGRLHAFEYRVGITEIYRVERDSKGQLFGKQVEVDVELRQLAKGGHVVGSLGQALEHLGLGRELAGVFVEVFEQTVSFKKDTRAGDTFKILVDERYVDGEMLGYGDIRAIQYSGEKVGKIQAFWFKRNGKRGDFFDDKGRAMHGGWLRTPLRYDHISSGFNPRRRHPVLKRIMPHNGVDYAAARGTPVWAAADGVVTFAGRKGANGNLVALRHEGGYETFYAHLSRISGRVRAGTEVKQRTVIGGVGSTGRSTGPHLHFALKRHGRFLNPKSQLNGPGRPLPAGEMGRYRRARKALLAELDATALAAAQTSVAPEPEPAKEVFHDEGSLEL